MSTVAKVFSTILNTRLSNFMENQGIYAEEQNGFRKMLSCLDHLHSLTTAIRNRKAQQLSTFCVFKDCEKAFDSVHYPYLRYKLSAAGVHGHMLSMIQTMYSNLESCVRVNGRITDWFAQTAGVRQRNTLAPTLFALFINDSVPEINGLRRGVTISNELTLSIMLYADDVVLISETEDGLQTMLNSLYDWSNRWKLKVNEHKSKVIHFRRVSDDLTTVDFKYGGQELEIVPMYRYLGLDLYDTVDFSETVSALSKSASRALGMIASKYFTHDGFDYQTFTKLFESMVCRIMDYGCEIWGARKRDCMDVIHHRAMRTFLGVGKCAPLPMMYGDMHWIPSHTRQQAAMVRYWVRLLKMPPNRLNTQIFEWDYMHARRGTWCYDIKKILEKCDMSELYEQKSAGHDTVAKVRDNLRHIDSEQRKSDMATMFRMKVYRELNGDYNCTAPARYLLVPFSRHQGAALARLRSGTLALAIETGRYRQVNAEERLCKQCQWGSVEDELHFLFVCPKHTGRRDELLRDITNLNAAFSSYVIIRRTASFISGSMLERD